MNPLPPLPLIDGHFFIDNSNAESYANCPRQSQHSMLSKRVLGDGRAALNYGGAIHSAMQIRYASPKACVDQELQAEQNEALVRHFTERPNPVDSHRNLDLAQRTIECYNQFYAHETFKVLELDGKPAVELPFAFHLYTSTLLSDRTYESLGHVPEGKHPSDLVGPIDVTFCGRIDLLLQEDGVKWVLDHKTSSIFGDQTFKSYALSPQMIGYCYAIQKTTGELPNGFIVNFIKVPYATKAGSEMSASDKFFARLRTSIGPNHTRVWEKNIIALTEEMFWHYSRGYMPQKKSWCYGKFGPCQFVEVCDLEREEDQAMLLQSSLYTDNIWSPLNDFQKLTKPN